MRRTFRPTFVPGAVVLLVLGAAVVAPSLQSELRADEFPLKDGDVWVMAGDSITAQHLHSNYFEAFCYARYPKLKFAFRNSGVGGHTIPSTLARFDYDVAAWKPTVVSVELGMNDSGATATDKFVENMGTMVARIRASGARPVILAASPVNDGTMRAALNGRNARLHEYADALALFSKKESLPYADQFHALLDVWGKNKPHEALAGQIAVVRSLAGSNNLDGVDHLRAFLKAQDAKPVQPVSMQGDPVHPGPCGQLMMAAALLKGLGADGFVSSVTIDAADTSKGAVTKGCAVTDLKAADGGVSFDRLDESLPFPVPDAARAVLPLAPDVLALSQYTLQVKNLPAGTYLLKLDGKPCTTATAAQLAESLNLTSLTPASSDAANPIQTQAQAILKAVETKEGVVNMWRSRSRALLASGPEGVKELAELTKKVEDEDAKIRDAARPRKLHVEIVPQR